jgi:hypothetical protein
VSAFLVRCCTVVVVVVVVVFLQLLRLHSYALLALQAGSMSNKLPRIDAVSFRLQVSLSLALSLSLSLMMVMN